MKVIYGSQGFTSDVSCAILILAVHYIHPIVAQEYDGSNRSRQARPWWRNQTQHPSRAATILVKRGLVIGRALDYGCGYGLDAATFGWDAYDPYYRPAEPAGPYDTIVCTLVLNALSCNNRAKVLARIQELLAEGGRAYLSVARDLPSNGKLGMHHSLQNYVVLTLPSVYADAQLEIYVLRKTAEFADKTRDYMSRRDRHMRA